VAKVIYFILRSCQNITIWKDT